MPRSTHAKRTGLVAGLSLLLGLAAPSLSAANERFRDTFANNSVVNADTAPRFWTIGRDQGEVTEHNGRLVFTLPGGGGAAQTQTLRSHGARPTFNFFKTPHTFVVTGLTIKNPQASPDAGRNPQNSVFQFFLSPPDASSPTSANNTADLLGLRIRANGFVEFGVKQNNDRDNVFSGPRLHYEKRHGATPAITGFSLTLDADSFSLVIDFDDRTRSAPVTGCHHLDPAKWGQGPLAGESSIGLVVQSFLSAGKANDTTVALDSLVVRTDAR